MNTPTETYCNLYSTSQSKCKHIRYHWNGLEDEFESVVHSKYMDHDSRKVTAPDSSYYWHQVFIKSHSSLHTFWEPELGIGKHLLQYPVSKIHQHNSNYRPTQNRTRILLFSLQQPVKKKLMYLNVMLSFLIQYSPRVMFFTHASIRKPPFKWESFLEMKPQYTNVYSKVYQSISNQQFQIT